jgi:hypothetical protein
MTMMGETSIAFLVLLGVFILVGGTGLFVAAVRALGRWGHTQTPNPPDQETRT